VRIDRAAAIVSQISNAGSQISRSVGRGKITTSPKASHTGTASANKTAP
jgi:hypothetical protein